MRKTLNQVGNSSRAVIYCDCHIRVIASCNTLAGFSSLGSALALNYSRLSLRYEFNDFDNAILQCALNALAEWANSRQLIISIKSVVSIGYANILRDRPDFNTLPIVPSYVVT